MTKFTICRKKLCFFNTKIQKSSLFLSIPLASPQVNTSPFDVQSAQWSLLQEIPSTFSGKLPTKNGSQISLRLDPFASLPNSFIPKPIIFYTEVLLSFSFFCGSTAHTNAFACPALQKTKDVFLENCMRILLGGI